MKPMDVSIIIVNWNTRDMVRDCLASVYEQTCGVAFEVIVVDNASGDGSAEMVESEFSQVELIENSDNRGFAAANNQGMSIAKGRYVLLLNPDTLVLDGAIQKTIDFADRHPDVGIVGCQVWENNNTIQRTCFAFPSILAIGIQKCGLRRMFPRSKMFGWIDYGGWLRNTQREVDVVSGMFMLVRREAIDLVGLMDEDYFVYAEETDWCWRFQKAGWRCIFTPTARIIHRDGGNKSTDLVKVKMFVQMQKSLLIFYRKQRGWSCWIVAKMLYILSMFVRYIVFLGWSITRRDSLSSNKTAQSLAALKFHLFGIEPK